MPNQAKNLDCLVIGAGPAGLTAALYLARFHLIVEIVDAGKSRASLIPLTRNHAGYPGGICGKELLRLMSQQAAEFGVTVRPGLVETIERDGDLFVARIGDKMVRTHSVLLATGVLNNPPDVTPEVHDEALARGLLRYCPICDGYEVTDKRIGIIGSRTHGHNEALFLRMYSRDVTLIAPDGGHALSRKEKARLVKAGIIVQDGPCGSLKIDGDSIIVPLKGDILRFDTLYPALGSVIRSELAVMLGAQTTDDGCIIVDTHQRTSVAGLYAAGDVVRGLDQISHAMGEASVAASTIRNDLSGKRLLLR